MDTKTRRDLHLISHTLEYLANLEGQDLMLVIECGQTMIADLLSNDTLLPIAEYVKRYCDIIDSPAEVVEHETRIVAAYAAG